MMRKGLFSHFIKRYKEGMMVPSVLTREGKNVPLKYKPSSRAKRLSLRLSPKDVTFVLTIPPYTTSSQIDRFLEQCTPWIDNQLKKVSNTIAIKPGKTLSLHGEVYQCLADPLRRKPVLCRTTQTLHLPPKYEQKDLHAAFKKCAEETLGPYILGVAHELGQKVQKVTIRDTKSRWGSCSAQGKISLNWRLILAPLDVAHYVCIHEATHLLHMNHSKAFWKKVAELCPLYCTHQKWLKAHGPSLMRV